MAIHGAGLEDDEAVLVGMGGDKEDTCSPDREHSDYGLKFFNTVNS